VKKCLALLIVLLATSFSTVALAQDEATATAQAEESKYPVIAATEDGITLPTEPLVTGIVTLTLRNDTETPFSPILARFKEGKTMDDLMAAMQQGPDAPLAVVSILGGPGVPAGSSVDVTYELPAGDYLVASFEAPNAPPSILPFTVVEAQDAAATETPEPEADVSATMVEYAFGLPEQIKSGPQLWEIANEGHLIHEMVIFRVDDDATLPEVTETLMTAMQAAQNGFPEIPYESTFSWMAMSPGGHAWVQVDLEPGKYVVVCLVPENNTPHMAHGMIKLVTVSE
jgi:hypothetical protein